MSRKLYSLPDAIRKHNEARQKWLSTGKGKEVLGIRRVIWQGPPNSHLVVRLDLTFQGPPNSHLVVRLDLTFQTPSTGYSGRWAAETTDILAEDWYIVYA